MNRRVTRLRILSPASGRRIAGFTLIELMIAMILGLIVIAGVTSVFLAGQQSFRTNNALAEVEEGSRIAFELMARDIRGAGLSSCDSSNGRIANGLNPDSSGNTVWYADWKNPVHGYPDNSSTPNDPALSGITGPGAPVPGMPSLHVIDAGNLDASVSTTPSDVAANLRINQPSTNLQVGDIIVVCTLTGPEPHTSIVQITGPGSVGSNISGVVVVHNTGAGTPGNCTKGLDYPTVCSTNGSTTNLEPNSPISKLSAADWYIGTNSAGTRSLYRLTINGYADLTASHPNGTAQEMVRNVTNMAITYLQPPNTDFVPAASVTDWSVVSAVRVTLTVGSTFQRASVNAKPISRVYAATTTIRNRVD